MAKDPHDHKLSRGETARRAAQAEAQSSAKAGEQATEDQRRGTDPDDVLAAAHAEAEKIMAAARAAADSEVEAAKEEAIHIRSSASSGAVPLQDKTKRHIISVRVCAIKRGYANHRIYEPGDRFLFRYWSHQVIPATGELVEANLEKMLGGWMITADDPRFGRTQAELQDVRVAESDEADVTLAGEKNEDLNVL